jgi:hypothetical protein
VRYGRATDRAFCSAVEHRDSRSWVRAAWALLAKVDELKPRQVLVRRESWWGRPGWIGLLRIEDCVTAISPTSELVEPLTRALTDLSPSDALSPDCIIPRLPTIIEILGPAQLYYPGEHLAVATADTPVDVVPQRMSAGSSLVSPGMNSTKAASPRSLRASRLSVASRVSRSQGVAIGAGPDRSLTSPS